MHLTKTCSLWHRLVSTSEISILNGNEKRPKGLEDYPQLFGVILQQFSHFSFDSTGINNDESLNFRVVKKGFHFLSFPFHFFFIHVKKSRRVSDGMDTLSVILSGRLMVSVSPGLWIQLFGKESLCRHQCFSSLGLDRLQRCRLSLLAEHLSLMEINS